MRRSWKLLPNQSRKRFGSDAPLTLPLIDARQADLLSTFQRRQLHPSELLAPVIRENNIKTLNAAGNRGSKEPKVASFVKQAL
jgi:hypothetical protein